MDRVTTRGYRTIVVVDTTTIADASDSMRKKMEEDPKVVGFDVECDKSGKACTIQFSFDDMAIIWAMGV